MHGRNLTENVENNSFFICVTYLGDNHGEHRLSGTKRIQYV